MSLLAQRHDGTYFVIAVLIHTLAWPLTVPALGQTDVVQQEKVAADRFLKVLIQRPRPGTSLNQVYGFHVRNGSLDRFLTSLQTVPDQVAGEKTLASADTGASLMILGLIQLQRGKSDAAVQALKQAEGLRPSDAVCSFYLGKAYLALNKTELAAEALERAIQRRPTRHEAIPIFTELGKLYGRAGASKKALAVWHRLEQQFPGDHRVAGQIAATLAEDGNLNEALTRFELLANSARRDNDKINFAIQAAEIKRRLGNTKQATQDLETILDRLRPGSWLHTDVLNRIEDGFLKSGELNALADYYQDRLNSDVDNLELMIRLGRIFVSIGQLDDGKKTLQAAVARAPNDTDVRLALIDILVRQDDASAAATQYEQLAKQDPSNPDYLLKWGQLLLEDQNLDFANRRNSAARIWQQLADARNDDAVTLAQVADRMKSIDRPGDAIALYRQASELDPTAAQYREYLGEYLYQLKRKAEAFAAWESIAQDGRRNADSLIRLAEIYRSFKLHEKSLTTWKAASEFDLTFYQEVRYAEFLRASKQFEAALKRLTIAGQLAETSGDRLKLLEERISTYSDAGILSQQIEALQSVIDPSVNQLRELAMMHQAAGQLAKATLAITSALHQAPDNTAALSLAADILERQYQLEEATRHYKKLASLDLRRQTKHLKKVAQLQIRLGQSQTAMQTCEQLIQANPSSIESYLFTASASFQLKQSENGIEALRRAMSVARRDTRPRIMLASEFAALYRTSEAIELYWQAFHLESKRHDRIDIIRNLVPLYQRQEQTGKLLERIRASEALDHDTHSTELFLAAANETLQDYAAATRAIERLLARKPRDLDLLRSMVRLSLLSKKLADAAQFQQKIVDIEDTTANQFQLLKLKFDAGQIDMAGLVSQKLSQTNDPVILLEMLNRAANQGDLDTAILIARDTLQKDATLWNVQLALASLLASQGSEESAAEASKICDDIVALQLLPQTLAPTGAVSTVPHVSSRSSLWISKLSHLRAYMIQLATHPTLNQLPIHRGSWQRGSSRIKKSMSLSVSSYGEAMIAAIMIDNQIRSRKIDQSKRKAWLLSEIETQHALPDDLQQVTNSWDIIKYQTLVSLASLTAPHIPSTLTFGAGIAPPPPSQIYRLQQVQSLGTTIVLQTPIGIASFTPQTVPSIAPVDWRLFELSPADGWTKISHYCDLRFGHHHQVLHAISQADEDSNTIQQFTNNEPLTEAQLSLLVSQFNRLLANNGTPQTSSFIQIYSLASKLQYEFALANNNTAASKYAVYTDVSNVSYRDMQRVVQFHATASDRQSLDALVKQMSVALRKEIRLNSERRKPISVGPHSTLTWSMPTDIKINLRPHLLNQLIALTSYHESIAPPSRKASRPSQQTSLPKYAIYNQNVVSRPQPLMNGTSPLLNPILMHQLYRLYPELSSRQANFQHSVINRSFVQPRATRYVQNVDFKIEEVTDELTKAVSDIPNYEMKTRRILAAFLLLKNRKREESFQVLQQLLKDFPKDDAIRIELARVAQLMQKHDEVIDILQASKPFAGELQLQQSLLLMSSAAKLKEMQILTQVADRLTKTPMDWITAFGVSKTLSENQLTEQAIAVLKSLPRDVSVGHDSQVQIAVALHRLGEQDISVQLATQLLKTNISHSQPVQSRASHDMSDVVTILRETNQLNVVVEEAKQDVFASPDFQQPVNRLFQLYEVVGMTQELLDFQDHWATQNINLSASMQIKFGKRMLSRGEYSAAGKLILMACNAHPDRTAQHSNDLLTVAGAGYRDQILEGLLTIPLNQISDDLIKDLLRVDRRLRSKTFSYADFSDTEKSFIVHLLTAAKDINWALHFMNTVPEDVRRRQPEFHSAVLNVISHAPIFQSHSAVWNIKPTIDGSINTMVMEQVLSRCSTDIEARKILTSRITAALRNAEQSKTASFLQAILELRLASKNTQSEALMNKARDDLSAILKQMQTSKELSNPGLLRNHQTPQLSQMFLRQAAQVIESTPRIPSKLELLHAIFEICPLNVDPATVTFDNSILPTMLKAYRRAGQSERAIDRLLAADQQTSDISEMGSSQTLWDRYLKRKLWIANELLQTGASLEALAICRRELDDEVRITASSKLKKVETPSRLRALEAQARGSITPDSSAQYLLRLEDRIKAPHSKPLAIDFIVSPALAFRSSESRPIFLIAVQQVATTKQGQQWLTKLDAVLDDNLAAFDTPSSAIAARLTIGCVLNSDQVGELANRYIHSMRRQKFPTPESSNQINPIRTNLAVLAALSSCENAQATQAFESIKADVAERIQGQQDFASAIILAQRFGHTDVLIDQHIADFQRTPEQQLRATQILFNILKHALNAAEVGQMQSATAAFSLALSRQPIGFNRWHAAYPKPPSSQSAGSVIAIHERQKLTNQIQSQTRLVLKAFEFQCKIQEAKLNPSLQIQSSTVVAKKRHLTVTALQQLIFSADGTSVARLYAKDIAPAAGQNMQGVNFTKNGFEVPVSAAQTLIRIAAHCGRLDEVSQKIQGQSTESAILRIFVARQRADSTQLEDRLRDFQQQIEPELKSLLSQTQLASVAAIPTKGSTSVRRTSTQQAAAQLKLNQQSAAKSRMVNQILHATWAISLTRTKNPDGQRSQAQLLADKLLLQADSIIESDDVTMERLSRISRIIQNQVKANTAAPKETSR
ncbi:MAG: tetratricopeptide repeat protein [Fuerstiella sp.]